MILLVRQVKQQTKLQSSTGAMYTTRGENVVSKRWNQTSRPGQSVVAYIEFDLYLADILKFENYQCNDTFTALT